MSTQRQDLEIVCQFLPALREVLTDSSISEVMVNPSESGYDVFVEKKGVVSKVPGVVLETRLLVAAAKSIARLLGQDFTDKQPVLDARLSDGSRVAVVGPPNSLHGVTFTLRKFSAQHWKIEDLVASGTLTEDLAQILRDVVRSRQNIVIAGGTSTGKTTMLNILADAIDDRDRIVVIEDTAEIKIRKPNLVRFEASKAQGDVAAVTVRDLVKATLRHRPDRIVLGEIRSGEAFDLLQALNTGHGGSMTTLHANGARQALSRLAHCCLESGVELPFEAVRAAVGDAIQIVVHLVVRDGRRYVSEVLEVRGYDGDRRVYDVVPLYSLEKPTLRAVDGQDGPRATTGPRRRRAPSRSVAAPSWAALPGEEAGQKAGNKEGRPDEGSPND